VTDESGGVEALEQRLQPTTTVPMQTSSCGGWWSIIPTPAKRCS
jgi:hypothetical protein